MIFIDVQKELGEFSLTVNVEVLHTGITALFGRSGSGKTTLVNMVAGLTHPDRGRIIVGDDTVFDSYKGINISPEKRRIGYVFQEDRLFPHMSVVANLHYGANSKSQNIDFSKIVKTLGIHHLLNRRPSTLSGGEKQRVAIGRALLARPRLLLMDEPLASLDASRKDEILPFIEELSVKIDLPIIYVSHGMDEVIRLAKTLVIMSNGKVAATGPVEELTSRLDLRPMTGRFEAGSVINVHVAEQDSKSGLTKLKFEGGDFLVPRIEIPQGRKIRIRIRARDVSITTTNPKNISINNIFFGKIQEISETDTALVDILVNVGAPIWARILKSSADRLMLKTGKLVYIMIKAVSIDRHSVGRIGSHKNSFDRISFD